MDFLPYVEAPRGERPVVLRNLTVRAVVSGLLAETTQTMVFYNPNGRPLEGSLVFPLPDGAVVCGYGLDVDGELVDGVVVPKQEARRILEAEERKGVDPGLLEQVAGNVYRTRIYPLPAGGTRTVSVTYVSELTVENNSAAYHLPLKHAAGIERVELRVEVMQAPVQPVISGGPGNLTLQSWRSGWLAEATLPRGVAADNLQVKLPDLPSQVVALERAGDHVYFCVSAKQPPSVQDGPGFAPKRLALAWDASGSRAGQVDLELELLALLMKRWGTVTVDLVLVRDKAEAAPQVFQVVDGDATALVAHLREVPFDGGTRLGALDLGATPSDEDEAWLLFSDGLDTFDSGLPGRGSIPLFAITGQAHNHSGRLSHLARQHGGRFVNLLRTMPDASARLIAGSTTRSVFGATSGCQAVHTAESGSRAQVYGVLDGAEAGSLELDGQRLILDPQKATAGTVVGRAWAGLEVARLALDGEQNNDAVLELGRSFGLVTPGSSLLVLETLEQHLEYKVEPAKSRAAMRRQYLETMQSRRDLKRRDESNHVDQVLGLWRNRVSWWETDFRPRWREQPPKKEKKQRARARDTMTGAAPPPPPAMAPAPEPMEAMADLCEPMPAAAPEDDMGARVSLACEAAPTARGAGAELKKKKGGGGGKTRASIAIKPWSPDTPYLAAMKAAPAQGVYATYVDQRPDYATSPSFFLDCGDFLLSAGLRDEGLRVLSNLLELGLDEPSLMRMYAWRLQQAGELDGAVAVFDRVLSQRDDEPQSHRDLGLALGERWEAGGDEADAARAMELLYDVIVKDWDRFPEIELIALMELNRLIQLCKERDVAIPARIDGRLIKRLDLDLRLSMSWDADLTDVDLHVYEPTGEHAYYGHNQTRIGGLVSRDFTQGYGPEEYVLRRAYPGKYTVKAHYYGSSQQSLTGPCTVIVRAFTNYGRSDEQTQVLTLRLDEPSDQVLVGEITVEGQLPGEGQPEEPPWRSRFAGLSRGMTLTEITAAAGQPDTIKGDELAVLVYRPEEGVEVQVICSPRLSAVKLVMQGAVLDLV